MPRITPNLWFDTESKEAAEFYVSVFPNSRDHQRHLLRRGRSGTGRHRDDRRLRARRPGVHRASTAAPNSPSDEAISLLINCADQDEVDYYWTKLSAGGEEGPCGWLKDRYGLSWQVIPAALDELADRSGRGPGPAGHEGHARHEEDRRRRAPRRRRPSLANASTSFVRSLRSLPPFGRVSWSGLRPHPGCCCARRQSRIAQLRGGNRGAPPSRTPHNDANVSGHDTSFAEPVPVRGAFRSYAVRSGSAGRPELHRWGSDARSRPRRRPCSLTWSRVRRSRPCQIFGFVHKFVIHFVVCEPLATQSGCGSCATAASTCSSASAMVRSSTSPSTGGRSLASRPSSSGHRHR